MQYIGIWKETPERPENVLYMETSLPLHLYLLNAELALQANLWGQRTKPSQILPWRLPQAGRGRRPLTFLDTVARDVGLNIGDL